MNYKDYLFFIGQCLTINHIPKNKEAVQKRITSDINWDDVVKVSTAHYVLPALYFTFKNADFLELLPKDLVDFMQHISQLNADRNTEILQQVHEINNFLLSNDIQPIFIKGTAYLLENVYENIGERMIGDIDFLVSNKDFDKAIKLLSQEKYTPVDKHYKEFHWHYPRLCHEDEIAAIEVHKKVLKDDVEQNIEVDFFSNTTIVGETKVLSETNKILSTVLPKIINDDMYVTKSISLKTAYDVFLLFNNSNIKTIHLKNKKINNKLNNYLTCIQTILNDSQIIKTHRSKSSKQYLKKYMQLLEGNSFERFLSKYHEKLFFQKERFNILKYAFTKPDYRKYLIKIIKKQLRISQQ